MPFGPWRKRDGSKAHPRRIERRNHPNTWTARSGSTGSMGGSKLVPPFCALQRAQWERAQLESLLSLFGVVQAQPSLESDQIQRVFPSSTPANLKLV
jgi:hypothetical protein